MGRRLGVALVTVGLVLTLAGPWVFLQRPAGVMPREVGMIGALATGMVGVVFAGFGAISYAGLGY